VVVEARLTRDTEWFSKMDPYATLLTEKQMFKTRTMNGAGKTPRWNQEFDLDVNNLGDDICVRVFDENVVSSDLIGECTLKFSVLCDDNGIDKWFPITYNGDHSGTIHLKSTWTPSNMNFKS